MEDDNNGERMVVCRTKVQSEYTHIVVWNDGRYIILYEVQHKGVRESHYCARAQRGRPRSLGHRARARLLGTRSPCWVRHYFNIVRSRSSKLARNRGMIHPSCSHNTVLYTPEYISKILCEKRKRITRLREHGNCRRTVSLAQRYQHRLCRYPSRVMPGPGTCDIVDCPQRGVMSREYFRLLNYALRSVVPKTAVCTSAFT